MTPALVYRALLIAQGEVGVRETSRNRGPRVDEYHEAAGLNPAEAHSWCGAFVIWCFREAARALDAPNPRRMLSPSVHRMWQRNGWARTLTPKRGAVFCHDSGDGKGHCGFVIDVYDEGNVLTVEGNTNQAGSREGDSVATHVRPVAYANLGFLDFSLEASAQPIVAASGDTTERLQLTPAGEKAHV